MKQSNKVLWTVIGGCFVGVLLLAVTVKVVLPPGQSNPSFFSMFFKQIEGNGKLVDKAIPVSSFNTIDVAGRFNVDLNFGKNESVTMRMDENLLPYIRVEVANNHLAIGSNSKASLKPSENAKVVIAAKSLQEIRFGGKTKLNATNINAQNFSVMMHGKSVGNLQGDVKNLQLKMAGKSELQVNVSNANMIELVISGKGEVNLKGKVKDLTIITSGDALVMAKDLVAQHVTIRGAGNSMITVNAAQTLTVTTAGHADVKYLGNPVVTKHSVGEASVEKLK